MTDEQAERIVSLALRMRAVEARLIVKATEGTLKELRELQLEAVKLTQDCGGRSANPQSIEARPWQLKVEFQNN